MDNIADVSSQKNHSQGADDCSAVGGNHRTEQAEDTDGGQLQDHFHAFHEYGIQAVDAADDHGSLIANQNNGEADQQRHDNDLQHIGLRHWLDKVGWKDVYQCIHKGCCLGSLIGQIGCGNHREQALEQVTADQTNGNGKGGGTQVINDSFQADGTHLADILHGNDTAHDGEQHDGNDNEFEKIEENGAKGLDVAFSKFRMISQKQTRNDGQHQRNKDLHGKG